MGKRLRLALFGSFYRGYYVLYELLNGELKDTVEVVGVASDDPKQSFVSPKKKGMAVSMYKERRDINSRFSTISRLRSFSWQGKNR